jgi:hypothetical protein
MLHKPESLNPKYPSSRIPIPDIVTSSAIQDKAAMERPTSFALRGLDRDRTENDKKKTSALVDSVQNGNDRESSKKKRLLQKVLT